jgi:hypothetical protein
VKILLKPVFEVDFLGLQLRLEAQALGDQAMEKLRIGFIAAQSLWHGGIDASTLGTDCVRCSLATDLVGRGECVVEIAGPMCRRSLPTTHIYASVDIAALPKVALPRPKASS